MERQLRLFATDNAELLEAAERAERAYDRAPREEAEERYGDYVDLCDEGAALLADLRDTYARTLGEDAAERYAAVFDRRAARRLPRFAPRD